MKNQFDLGMQEDFDNMTYELGRECRVYLRKDDINYEGQEDTSSGLGTYMTEIVFLQELDTQHEMIKAGQMNVGDVRFTFQHSTIAEEEGYVTPDEGKTWYKILQLTDVGNQSNNVRTYMKAFGKKVPGR